MKINIINEMNNDIKMHDYLIKHSAWYRLINRNPNNYNKFLSEYKSYKRNEKIDKATEFMDNIETISSVISMLN